MLKHKHTIRILSFKKLVSIWNYKIIAKQNKITLIIIFYNSISYSRLASPACGTPIEENYSAHTDTYISGFNLRDFRWNEKLRKMRYVPDIGEPKQPIPPKKVEMISEEANLTHFLCFFFVFMILSMFFGGFAWT